MIYRNAFAELFSGLDEAMAPFLNATRGNLVKAPQLQEMLPDRNTLPLTPQIIGNRSDLFLPLALKLHEMGHGVVNWNLGCPFPTMTKKGCGAGLLPHPDKIEAFLGEVCAAFPGQISVKVRLGLLDKRDLDALIPIFNNHPLAELIIHPRTGKQMYKGHVDLDAFGVLCERSRHPVVYNGDITDIESFKVVRERFEGVQKFMLGRGLFANPLLASELQTGEARSVGHRHEMIFTLHDVLLRRYSERLSGPAHLYHKMTGHWEYWHLSFPKGKKFYQRLKRLKNVSDYSAAVQQYRASVLK